MAHSLAFNIHEKLAKYLANEISLNDFEDWFFPETWDITQPQDLNLLNLIYSIKLRLAEFSNHDWSEDQLRSLLGFISANYVIGSLQEQLQFGTSNRSSQKTTSFVLSSRPSNKDNQAEASFNLSDRPADTKLLTVCV